MSADPSSWGAGVARVVWVASVIFVTAAPGTGRATQRLGESPHGRSDRCLTCHVQTANGERGASLPPIATCRGCHPDAEMHPVGMKPVAVTVPAAFPLEQGAVTCATCHAEPDCDPARDESRPWLRGGTPSRKADFCFRCHESQALERESPHLALTQTDPADAGCPACHSVRPEPGATVALAGLLLPPAETCATCHPGPDHLGAAEHVGNVQDPARLSREAARVLPLGAGGVIGCWTCHDVHAVPHAVSVAAPSALAAALGPARRVGPDPLLALPVSDGRLCTACHGANP